MNINEDLHTVGCVIGKFKIEELWDFLRNELGFTKFYSRFNGQFQGFELLRRGKQIVDIAPQQDEEAEDYIIISTSVEDDKDLRVVLETVVRLTNQGYEISWL